ncbi:hypothetical protein TRFO_14685 [Tritrichomonas foetus]|uniref:ATPase n=1 Tax=Tritrichomonas foetus TaxID=1144522 RepID=A0A1J4KYV9_9EUKA|nr:hypothetical protein TRFO_14685 [Tritrichomonas foetus]|eukprot:OHT14894.1 hypothetical protein TRFO_14685 [Tritrichomonas foetus]
MIIFERKINFSFIQMLTLSLFLIQAFSRKELICSRQIESKIAVIDHKFPKLNSLIQIFQSNGFSVFLGNSHIFSVLVTNRSNCPSNSQRINFDEYKFLEKFYFSILASENQTENNLNCGIISGVKNFKITGKYFLIFLILSFSLIFVFANFFYSQIQSMSTKDFLIRVTKCQSSQYHNFSEKRKKIQNQNHRNCSLNNNKKSPNKNHKNDCHKKNCCNNKLDCNKKCDCNNKCDNCKNSCSCHLCDDEYDDQVLNDSGKVKYNVSNYVKSANSTISFWRHIDFQFTPSYQLSFDFLQKYTSARFFKYNYQIPISIECDEFEDSIDSFAEIKSMGDGTCEINFNAQNADVTLRLCSESLMIPRQNTTHYFLLNLLFSGMMFQAIDSIKCLEDIRKFLSIAIQQLDVLGMAVFTLYQGEFNEFYCEFKNDEVLTNIVRKRSKEFMFRKHENIKQNKNDKQNDYEPPFYEEFVTLKHYRISIFSAKMGFMKFVFVYVRNNNLISFRLAERSLCHILSKFIPCYIISLLKHSGRINIKRFHDIIKIHRSIDIITLSSDFSKTIKKIGNTDREYIINQINNLPKGERRLWENKISRLQKGTAFCNRQCKTRFHKTASLFSNDTFISFAIQKKSKLINPLLQLASFNDIVFFRKDGSIINGKNFFGTPFTVNNILDIIDSSQIPAFDSFINFQISANIHKTGFLKLFSNSKNSVSGIVFPVFDEKPDCLNIFEIGNDQHFMIWLLDSSKLYPVWMMINNDTLAALNECNVHGLYSICHPDDVSTLKSSMDHALSVLTVSLTMELRMKIVTSDYQWHQIMINRRAGHFILFFAMNINEWKSQISLLQEMDQSLTTALSYGQVINWVFEDNYFPQRVYINEPISKSHVVFNWTTIEHNVPGEYYDFVANSLKDTLETGKTLRMVSPMIFDSIKWYSTYASAEQKSGTIIGFDFDIAALKEAEQQAAMQKKAAEEAIAAKSIFLANMTHEIRTPLNGICGLIELLQSSPLDKEKLEMVEVVHNAFVRLMDLLTDTLELAKIEQNKTIPMSVVFDPLEALVVLSKMCSDLSKQTGILIRSKTDPSLPRLVKGDPKFLTKISSILLSNAYKFTVKGHVKFKLTFIEEKGFLMTVKDTGIGMTDDTKRRIYETFTQGDSSVTRKYGGIGVGLALVKRMLDLIGGTITYQSEINVGSSFEVFFPAESIYEIYVPPRLKAKHKQIFVPQQQAKGIKMLSYYASYFGFEVTSDLEKIDFNRISLIFVDDFNYDLIDFAQNLREKIPELMIVLVNYTGVLKQRPGFMSVTRPISIQQIQRIMIQNLWGKRVQKKEEVPIQGLKILLADENMTSSFVIKTFLERLDCIVILASNGAEVIEICQKESFDVIFLDHHMPIMDGPTSIGIIRKLDSYNANCQIIFMSSHIPDNQLDDKYGADYILDKPVTQQKLSDLLQVVCHKINYQAFK